MREHDSGKPIPRPCDPAIHGFLVTDAKAYIAAFGNGRAKPDLGAIGRNISQQTEGGFSFKLQEADTKDHPRAVVNPPVDDRLVGVRQCL
jgi:hypothetical protein